MDTKTLIDQVIRDHEGQDPTDADNANLRLQILANAQTTVDDLEGDAWPWPHLLVWNTALAMTTSGDLDMPDNFLEFGLRGTLWINPGSGVPAIPVFLKPLQEVRYYRQRFPAGVQYPRRAAISGWNTTTRRKILSIGPVPIAALTMAANYRRRPVTLLDQVDPGSGLDQIPPDLHGVIYTGTVMGQMSDKGDLRADTSQDRAYERQKQRAKENNNPMLGQVMEMPIFPGAIGQ